MSKENKIKMNVYKIIFEADTKAGKLFDVFLLWAILLSVITVMLESVSGISLKIGGLLRITEWIFTIIFTIEFLVRILVVKKPVKYIFSFFGFVDFIAVIPTYLYLIVGVSQYLLIIRTIRLLRVFRIFKLSRYLGEANLLVKALKASRYKITVFLGAVLSILIIMGTLMYLVETPESGFTSIPRSIYWGIVTLTTVGYGDISPQTVPGQILASIIMIMGYAIIAVPTGIVTVELSNVNKLEYEKLKKKCPSCKKTEMDRDAVYCKYCGKKLLSGKSK